MEGKRVAGVAIKHVDRVLYEYHRVVEQRHQQLLQRISHAISGIATRQEMRVSELTGTLIFVPEEGLNLLRLDVKVVVVFVENRHKYEY